MAITINGKNPIPPGPPGLSPYQVAAAGGYTGTEAEFNAALADIGGPQDAADPNGSLYARVNSLFTSVSEGKGLIAAAVTDKGVQTAADESFASMAGKIGQIESGSTLETVRLNLTWRGSVFFLSSTGPMEVSSPSGDSFLAIKGSLLYYDNPRADNMSGSGFVVIGTTGAFGVVQINADCEIYND